MDQDRFDQLTRLLSRRDGLRAALAALAAGALAAAPEGARARRRCRRDSPPGQCCRKRDGVVSCTCRDGGVPCGADCCLDGTRCEAGACVPIEPPAGCIAFGQPCKNAGIPCCEGTVCGSGQGGEGDVACRVPAGGPCAATAECVYGATCQAGTCVADPQPTPAPACAPTFPATGDADANGAALRTALKAADPTGPVEIVLAAGEYAMPNFGWLNAGPLVIRACPGAAVTLRPNAAYQSTSPFFEINATQVTFDGIALVGPGLQAGIGGPRGIYAAGGSSLTLRRCTVTGFSKGVDVKNVMLAIDGGDYRGNDWWSIAFEDLKAAPDYTITCTGSPLAGACCVPASVLAACGCSTNCP